MSNEDLLLRLKNTYQENAEWYKTLGNKSMSDYYQAEMNEVERLIQLEKGD